MYSNDKGFCKISEKDGWVFKNGNVANAADVNLDTKSWIKFKPSDLSGENLDKNGRFEGWFRLKLRFENSPGFTPPGITNYTWNASEVFANGRKIAAFGQPAHDQSSFKESNPSRKYPIQTNFQPDSTYIIAVHIVAYADPFSVTPKLKGGDKNASIFLLTNKTATGYFVGFWPLHRFYDGLLSAITATLSLLFWILFGLNRNEKNIMRFAIGCTFLAILSISVAFSTGSGIGYTAYVVINFLAESAVVSYVFYIPFILAGVFSRNIPRLLKLLIGISYLIVLGTVVLRSGGWILLCAIVPLVIAFYYLVTTWKALKGAQWAIVSGFLLSFIFLVVYVCVGSSQYTMAFVLIYTVSPPLGMLIYVSVRFGEMIYEVRIKAAEVLNLSEEKREQAMSQQKFLEAEVEKQTADLRSTLTTLKATQSQLIQAEKMASLGELTAGIAHEIQNPLNFVNNFSDVSNELIDEMNEELEKGDVEEAKVIANDIKQNLEKINHHGKRADTIVKGMLQHSRSSSATKEATDINKLADEYLRLAYHGLRAKDQSFNANLETDFDNNIGDINIISQDIGRVILNLLTNAFYVVDEKKKTGLSGYDPIVRISTKKSGEHIIISVKDNGNGIPQKVIDKIFQPFFTTKPAGQGTGLGLSLAYDIIKAHGGELKVETIENVGTGFIIQLPSH
jgi:signal transduction histidine kinase